MTGDVKNQSLIHRFNWLILYELLDHCKKLFDGWTTY